MSLAILGRDLLTFLGNSNLEAHTGNIPPPVAASTLSENAAPGRLKRWIFKKINEIWDSQRVVFDGTDLENILKAFWKKYEFRVLAAEFSESETQQLVEMCHEYGVTVNSAINIAFIAARTTIVGPFQGGRRNVMIPVDTREFYIPPIEDQFGLYASGFHTKFSYNPKQGFWENVEAFDARVKKNLDVENVLKEIATLDYIDPTLIDAQSFSFMGQFVPHDFSRAKKLRKFSADERNLSNRLAQKKIPNLPGLAVTNLGRLEYPRTYGTLELDRFFLVASASPNIELVIPIVTVAGKLTLTVNYLEEVRDTDTMKKILGSALEFLGIKRS